MPKTALEGEELGLKAGETNQQEANKVIERIQGEFSNNILSWYLMQQFELELSNYSIIWNNYTEPTEAETLDNLLVKASIFEQLKNVVKDPVKLAELIDLGIEVLSKEEMEAKAKEVMNNMNAEEGDEQEEEDSPDDKGEDIEETEE
jgi:hypothetical protein